jgi:predicted GNAT family N-acyltransferase
MPEIFVTEIAPQDTLEEILELRRAAFANDPQDNDPPEPDDHEGHAFHWVIRDDGSLVASARLCIHERIDQVPDSILFREIPSQSIQGPIACINRLIIHPDYRGRKLTRHLDAARLERARQLGCVSLIFWASYPDRIRQFVERGARVLGMVPTGRLARVKVPIFLGVLSL